MFFSFRRAPNLSDLFGTLPESHAERLRRLETVVAAWFDAQPGGNGTPEEALLAAEARLGVSLPLALRKAYLAFGRREELTRTDNDAMLPPERLRIRGGVLFFWEAGEPWSVSDEWGVRVADLSLDDPPVVYLDLTCRRAGAVPGPAFTGSDGGLSRFLLRMALEALCTSSVYVNSVEADSAEQATEIARRFARLDLGELTQPPVSVLYGGEGVILRVVEENVYLAAPDRKSYRRAVKKLAGHALGRTEREARRSESYRERRERVDEGMARIWDMLRAGLPDRKPTWASKVPGAMSGTIGQHLRPIDACIEGLVDAAIAPYRLLLPPRAVEIFRHQLAAVVETHPSMGPGWFWLFHGGPPPPGEPRRGRQHPRILPVGGWLTDEQRAFFDNTFESDDNDLDAFMRRYTPAMARLPPDGPPAEDAILARSCEKLARFVAFVPAIAAPNERAAERGIAQFLGLAMGSLFAGMIGSFMLLSKDAHLVQCVRYVPARLVFDRFLLRDPEMDTFASCYAGDGSTADVAKRLQIPNAEAYERHRSFLARLGPLFAEGAARLLGELAQTTDLPKPEAALWASTVAFRTTYAAGKKMLD